MAGRERHVVAFGGFNGDTTLRDYVLELTGAARPKVCFLGTAVGDSTWAIAEFYDPRRRCHIPRRA